MYAFVGDSPFSFLSNYDLIPHSSFGVINTVWNATCLSLYYAGSEWAAKEMVRLMFNVLRGLAFAIHKRGITLPEPPQILYKTIGGERWAEPNHHKDLLPIISLANAVSKLPIELFSYIFELIRYSTGIFPVQRVSENGGNLSENLEAIRRWAIVPNRAMVCGITLATQEDIDIFNHELNAVHSLGSEITTKLIMFLMEERVLELKEKAWIGVDPLQIQKWSSLYGCSPLYNYMAAHLYTNDCGLPI